VLVDPAGASDDFIGHVTTRVYKCQWLFYGYFRWAFE
jgi:hypothetical protein